MTHAQVIVLATIVSMAGCASEKPDPLATTPRQSEQGDEDVPAQATSNPANPKYSAAVEINAAKKNKPGMKCGGDMGATGWFGCGPEESLTDLSWEFVEHRDGQDFYRFNWTHTSNGSPTNSIVRTLGFDGVSETTVIDAEHYIVIRKGPLNPKRAAEAK
jgi:hypothetical protein